MDNSEEKRYFPRAKINHPIQVDTGDAQIPGRMQNLTIEGIAFTLGQHVSAGAQVAVEILSENKEIRSNSLNVEVLRCELQENETPPAFLISGKLMEANDVYLHDVMALIFGRRT